MAALPYIIAPAGVHPASFFSPAIFVSPARPPAFLADNIDPANGEIASLLIRVHPVDAAIQEAFRLARGTGAAVQEAGQRFSDIKKNTSFADRQIRDECKRIIKPFEDRGDARLVQIQVSTDEAPDLGAAVVKYTNLRTGRPQKVLAR